MKGARHSVPSETQTSPTRWLLFVLLQLAHRGTSRRTAQEDQEFDQLAQPLGGIGFEHQDENLELAFPTQQYRGKDHTDAPERKG